MRQALEEAPAGPVHHAVAEEGVAFRDIAEAVGCQLAIPVVAWSPEIVDDHFAQLRIFVGMDSQASSVATWLLLGWKPGGPNLVEQLAAGQYTSRGAPSTPGPPPPWPLRGPARSRRAGLCWQPDQLARRSQSRVTARVTSSRTRACVSRSRARSAKAVGHRAPSSSRAWSEKPSVA